MCKVSASASMASNAPGANATTTSAKRTWVVDTITMTKIDEITIATANEPSPALTYFSSVEIRNRAKREPIRAPMPTRATFRIQFGRPPSISEVPCSTLEAIIAPNIQLAGNFASRSSSATAIEPAISAVSSSGDAITAAVVGGADGAIPLTARISGSAAVRDDHAHGLNHGDTG